MSPVRVPGRRAVIEDERGLEPVRTRFRSGVPGPFRPLYEKAVSDEGIASCALMRGFVIAARASDLPLPDEPAALASSVRMTCAAISRLSGGHFGDAHDELLCVIRKPSPASYSAYGKPAEVPATGFIA
ncbi:MAG: hypothetical protein ABSF03_23540 [Streptosporangiaceae bacterium]